MLEFSGIDAFGGADYVEAYADRGTMRYDFSGEIQNEKLFVGRLGENELTPAEPPSNLEGGWHVEEDFLNAVRSNGRIKPRPSFEEGVRYMRVVQAVADSRARNEWVTVKT